MTTKKNRKHERVASLNLLHFTGYRNDVIIKQGMGRTLDVSESGILLETHFLMELQDQLSLTIGLEDDLVEMKGRVVYCNEEEGGKFKVGIEFFEVDEKALQMLEQYIVLFKSLEDSSTSETKK
ncbi:MAG: PilZ domain-containing protein [Desulfobacterales bacterium]